MTVTVKNKSALIVPAEIQRRAGLKAADRVEFKVSGGIINIIPELPTADDEYTPTQRRIIDARLTESEEDLKKGHGFGPFNSADEMVTHMKGQLKKRAAKKLSALDED